jgi:hypothetical protein
MWRASGRVWEGAVCLQPEGGAFFKGFVSLEDRCSNFWTRISCCEGIRGNDLLPFVAAVREDQGARKGRSSAIKIIDV